MHESLAPFSCTYSPNIPGLLKELNISLAVSTYQAGKLIFLSPKNDDELIQFPRTFQKPMGFAIDRQRLALATSSEIIFFKNSVSLAQHYPGKPNIYDAMFLPRATYHTGPVDIHDLSFSNQGLLAVNTLFSCIVRIDQEFNFTPFWKPFFISEISSEDRCHLNGMAMQNGEPIYATCFHEGNEMNSWKESHGADGLVVDVKKNVVLNRGLHMPHSPRLINNRLLILMSGNGELIEVDRNSGEKKLLLNLNGFVRGMASCGDFLFVGLSKIREKSSLAPHMKLDPKKLFAGIAVVYLPKPSLIGEIRYLNSVEEIYDVQMLPGILRPNIFNTIKDDWKRALMTPESTFWAVTSGDEKDPEDSVHPQ